jgi:hypothetical protein
MTILLISECLYTDGVSASVYFNKGRFFLLQEKSRIVPGSFRRKLLKTSVFKNKIGRYFGRKQAFLATCFMLVACLAYSSTLKI